jgi:hypothetical protein
LFDPGAQGQLILKVGRRLAYAVHALLQGPDQRREPRGSQERNREDKSNRHQKFDYRQPNHLYGRRNRYQRSKQTVQIMSQPTSSYRGLHYKRLLLAFALVLSSNTVAALPSSSDSTTPATPHLMSSWQFDCYAPGARCSGNGATHRGGSDTTGCTPVNAAGCNVYSFNGGGQYKLCLYSDDGCRNMLTSVDGGLVGCVSANVARWKTTIRGHSCT